jgi:hypothetical protein
MMPKFGNGNAEKTKDQLYQIRIVEKLIIYTFFDHILTFWAQNVTLYHNLKVTSLAGKRSIIDTFPITS